MATNWKPDFSQSNPWEGAPPGYTGYIPEVQGGTYVTPEPTPEPVSAPPPSVSETPIDEAPETHFYSPPPLESPVSSEPSPDLISLEYPQPSPSAPPLSVASLDLYKSKEGYDLTSVIRSETATPTQLTKMGFDVKAVLDAQIASAGMGLRESAQAKLGRYTLPGEGAGIDVKAAIASGIGASVLRNAGFPITQDQFEKIKAYQALSPRMSGGEISLLGLSGALESGEVTTEQLDLLGISSEVVSKAESMQGKPPPLRDFFDEYAKTHPRPKLPGFFEKVGAGGTRDRLSGEWLAGAKSAYSAKYGKGSEFAAEVILGTQAFLFAPARVLEPTVSFRDIRGVEWAIGAGQVAGLTLPLWGPAALKAVQPLARKLPVVGKFVPPPAITTKQIIKLMGESPKQLEKVWKAKPTMTQADIESLMRTKPMSSAEMDRIFTLGRLEGIWRGEGGYVALGPRAAQISTSSGVLTKVIPGVTPFIPIFTPPGIGKATPIPVVTPSVDPFAPYREWPDRHPLVVPTPIKAPQPLVVPTPITTTKVGVITVPKTSPLPEVEVEVRTKPAPSPSLVRTPVPVETVVPVLKPGPVPGLDPIVVPVPVPGPDPVLVPVPVPEPEIPVIKTPGGPGLRWGFPFIVPGAPKLGGGGARIPPGRGSLFGRFGWTSPGLFIQLPDPFGFGVDRVSISKKKKKRMGGRRVRVTKQPSTGFIMKGLRF